MAAIDALLVLASIITKACLVLFPLARFYSRASSSAYTLRHRLRVHRYMILTFILIPFFFLAAELADGPGSTASGASDAPIEKAFLPKGASLVAPPYGDFPADTRNEEADASSAIFNAVRRGWTLLVSVCGFMCAAGVFVWVCRVNGQLTVLNRVRESADRISSYEGVETIFSRRVKAPFSAGIFSPRIYLPVDEILDDEALSTAVIAHERFHIAKRHSLSTMLESFISCALWFHPLARLIRTRGELLRELDCDDAVITAGIPVGLYGKTIIAFAERCFLQGGHLIAAPPFGRISSLEERIRMLGGSMNGKSPAKLLRAIIMPAILIAAISTAIISYGCALEPLRPLPGKKPSVSKPETGAPAALIKAKSIDIQGRWPLGREFKRISLSFGKKKNPFSGDDFFHPALDIAAPEGAPIFASASGHVAQTGNEADGMGLYVVLEHSSGLSSRYAHCSEILVGQGDAVLKGALIAKVGSSGKSAGSHLHLMTMREGQPVDPLSIMGRPM